MRKHIKVLLILCMVLTLCGAGMFNFGAYAAEDKPFEYAEEAIIAAAESIVSQINGFDEDDLQYYSDNALGITKTTCDEYLKLRKSDSLGKFVEFKDAVAENAEDSVIVSFTAVYEKSSLDITVTYKEITNGSTDQIVPTDVSISAVQGKANSKGEALKNAALNTVMGISIVVIMLAVISFIISLFKYIPVIQDKFSKRKDSKLMPDKAVDSVVEQIAEKEELSSDTELVAVITAAICAATGASKDSFVVRSIRKSRFAGKI